MKVFSNAYKYYKELPDWAQGVVIVGGGLIVWFGVANPIRKLIIKKLDQEKEQRETKAAGHELNKLKRQGVSPTITKAQAESFSNTLRIAFSDCGTNEQAVYNVMEQMNNEADIYLLIDTYGIREYSGCGPWNVFAATQNVGLSSAISDEMPVEMPIINAILAKKGIKFRFT